MCTRTSVRPLLTRIRDHTLISTYLQTSGAGEVCMDQILSYVFSCVFRACLCVYVCVFVHKHTRVYKQTNKQTNTHTHNTNNELTKETVLAIRNEPDSGWGTGTRLAKKYGISDTTVGKIRRGQAYKWIQ